MTPGRRPLRPRPPLPTLSTPPMRRRPTTTKSGATTGHALCTPPTAAGESLHPNFVPKCALGTDTDHIAKEMMSGGAQAIAGILNNTTSLTMATILSGRTNTILLFHHPNYVIEEDGTNHHIVLTGTGLSSSIFILEPERAFSKKHKVPTPFASFLMAPSAKSNIDTLPCLLSDGEEMSAVVNLILPPVLTKDIQAKSPQLGGHHLCRNSLLQGGQLLDYKEQEDKLDQAHPEPRQ